MSIQNHVDHLLIDYLEHELSDAEVVTVEAHLAECATCEAELEKLRQTFDVLALDNLPEPDSVAMANFLPNVRAKIEASQQSWWQKWAPRLIPAVLPVAAMLIMFVWSGQMPQTVPQGSIPLNGVDTYSLEWNDADLLDQVAQIADEDLSVMDEFMDDNEVVAIFSYLDTDNLYDFVDDETVMLDDQTIEELESAEVILMDTETVLEDMDDADLEHLFQQLESYEFDFS